MKVSRNWRREEKEPSNSPNQPHSLILIPVYHDVPSQNGLAEILKSLLMLPVFFSFCSVTAKYNKKSALKLVFNAIGGMEFMFNFSPYMPENS